MRNRRRTYKYMKDYLRGTSFKNGRAKGKKKGPGVRLITSHSLVVGMNGGTTEPGKACRLGGYPKGKNITLVMLGKKRQGPCKRRLSLQFKRLWSIKKDTLRGNPRVPRGRQRRTGGLQHNLRTRKRLKNKKECTFSDRKTCCNWDTKPRGVLKT